MPDVSSTTRRPPALLAGLAFLIGLLGAAALGEVVCRILPVSRGLEIMPVNASDPIRHFAPDRRFLYSSDWRFSIVNRGRINNLGFVNDQDYDSTATTPLLAVIGDSYVEALVVPYDSTVQGRLAARVRAGGRVYSFGAAGAALSQYLAMASDAARRFHPAGMVFVVVGNDFDESLLHYAGTPGLHVFVDSAGRLVLRRLDYEARTLRGLVRSSAFGRYLAWNLHAHTQVLDLWHRLRHGSRVEAPVVGNTASQADSVRVLDSHRAIDAVLDRLPAATGLPANRMLFLLDGRRPDLYSDSAMTASSGSYFAIMRRYFQRAAEERGYEVRDLEPRFAARYKAAGTRFEFKTDGHWNSAGHAEAAATAEQSRVFTQVFGTLSVRAALPAHE